MDPKNLFDNLIFTIDAYKDLHDQMLLPGVTNNYAYMEARSGAQYPKVVFAGLQPVMMKWLEGEVITKEKIDAAEPILTALFAANGNKWDRAKWDYIVEKHGGKLPIYIKAAEEGEIIPVSNVMMTVEATDPECAWLVNPLETVLQAYIWYMTTTCTKSWTIRQVIQEYFDKTVADDHMWMVDYYLHDFGQRGVTCMEQAGLGGMMHLLNFKGTDTVMAIPYSMHYYEADFKKIASSCAASEHSVMTPKGEAGELEITRMLVKRFPDGILSVVGDSFKIDRFVESYVCVDLKEDILARNGKFVVRPDSPRFPGDTPQAQVLWIVEKLAATYGFTTNDKNFKVLNPKVGVLYGDGLNEHDIRAILQILLENGWAAENCVFGCGGYLLQKHNRDTERFAFKTSAQLRDGKWHNVAKEPTDVTKRSKAGRLKLIHDDSGELTTVPFDANRDDVLIPRFRDGVITRRYTFEDVQNRIRKNAK